MEKQLSFNLEGHAPGKVKNHPDISKRASRKKLQEQWISELLTNSEKKLKLKSLSLEQSFKEKQFSEVTLLKKNFPERQTLKKERFSDNLINVENVAEVLGVAPKTIRKWVSIRFIPFVRVGRRVLFRPKSIELWLNRKEEKPCQ